MSLLLFKCGSFGAVRDLVWEMEVWYIGRDDALHWCGDDCGSR